ncbi:MAG: sensor histidine kinase [Pseudonocardiaceae bacterium]|nr:sensor histidine kinase [Pseudonocardiaceae bacterium]
MVGDSLIAVLLGLLELPVLLSATFPDTTSWLAYTLGGLLLLAPLIFRRRHPLAGGYLVLLGAAYQLAVQAGAGVEPRFGPGPVRLADVALAISLYTLVAYVSRRRAAEYTGALTLAVIAWAIWRVGWPDAFWPVLGVLIVLSFSWLLGEFVGARRAYHAEVEQRLRMLETERDQQARIAVAEERARIARELHDVVAHSVSVMVVQADGAGYALRAQPELAESAVKTISETGRHALVELRRLLDVLRSDGEDPERSRSPQPGVDSLTELVDKMRAVGLPIVLEVRGSPDDLPTGVGLALYRIVQEALTNTFKHGGPGVSATVRLSRTPEEVTVEITDNGSGTPREPAGGWPAGGLASGGLAGGNGLIGMRERAAVFGGTLEAGPRTGGGWRVLASMPAGEF